MSTAVNVNKNDSVIVIATTAIVLGLWAVALVIGQYSNSVDLFAAADRLAKSQCEISHWLFFACYYLIFHYVEQLQ